MEILYIIPVLVIVSFLMALFSLRRELKRKRHLHVHRKEESNNGEIVLFERGS